MKKLSFAVAAALVMGAGAASAADLPVKARPVVAPQPPAWDVAFGTGVASDYIFRGITQSAHQPSVSGYFEPRYNFNKDLQGYAGVAGYSIDFPNRAAMEMDLYGGIRPTFGAWAFDIGALYYFYPGGQCFNNAPFCAPDAAFVGGPNPNPSPLPNGNFIKKNLSFYEVYGKVNYTFNDNFGVGAYVYYSPSVLNSGADGIYFGGTAKYTWAAWANGVTPYLSGEVARWNFGTTDAFYGTGVGTAFANGIPLPDYTTWNVGVGFAYKVFTLDLRYSDTSLNKGNCNALTSDHTASGTTNVTAINGGLGSNWCGSTFVAKLSADITLNSNIK